MARWVLLPLLLTCGWLRLQGAPLDGMEAASCRDPQVTAAARLALREINRARQDGYVLDLHRLTGAHVTQQGESGAVFYLRLQVAESNCSVLSREQEECRAEEAPAVIGVCKAAIFISRVHRVVRLYKYDCALRPAIHKMCADCPALMDPGDAQVRSVAARSLEKYHRDRKPSKRFALLKVTRASLSVSVGNIYNVDYTIQETTCTADEQTPTAARCPLLECEFTHRGFCRASQYPNQAGEPELSVECQIYESEAADREKALHEAQTDHAHNDTHAHDPRHDRGHPVDAAHTHDHVHDHTEPHSAHAHGADAEHHHARRGGGAHDHGHGHGHVHAHHAAAHDHSADGPGQHHRYEHGGGARTHEHDHELALDHEHKHAHMHAHEHHHHHHGHAHEGGGPRRPEGAVRTLPRLDRPAAPPAFPDRPEEAAAPPLVPDPDIPGQMEPFVRPFPAGASADCPAADPGGALSDLFSEDPDFKA